MSVWSFLMATLAPEPRHEGGTWVQVVPNGMPDTLNLRNHLTDEHYEALVEAFEDGTVRRTFDRETGQ